MISTLVLANTWAVETDSLQKTLVTSIKISLQTAHIICYIIGNTLELHSCRLLKFKNVNKWNPPELTIFHQNLARKWTYVSIALQWSTKLQLNLNLAASYIDHVIYQTRETVFHRDIQTRRGELKIRHAAEYFWWNLSCLDSRSMKHCLECLIYLLNRNKNLE